LARISEHLVSRQSLFLFFTMRSLLFASSFAASALAAVLGQPGQSVMNSPTSTVPEIQVMKTWSREDATVKKVRYGPFKIGAAKMKAHEMVAGHMTEAKVGITMPCNDCTLLAMLARLEYADGTEAKDPGTYMHHAAVLNVGDNAKDGNCQAPGIDLFFSSGNEKSTIIFTDPEATHKSGYYVAPDDVFLLQTEVLNNEPQEKQFWVSVAYEYLPNKQPGYQNTKTVWISYGSPPCSAPKPDKAPADVIPDGNIVPPNDKSFVLKSDEWVSPYDGDLIAMGGHMHNGGLSTEVYKNDVLICDSQATYEKGTGGGMRLRSRSMGAADEYLAKMSGCVMPGPVKKGDRFHIVAKYDFTQHPGMKNEDGKLAPIMAVATMFIGVNPEE
jgi:hypothetical protein